MICFFLLTPHPTPDTIPPMYPNTTSSTYDGITNWRLVKALDRMAASKPDDLQFTAGMALGLADGLYAAGGIGDSEWKSANLHMMHIWRTRKGTDQVANS